MKIFLVAIALIAGHAEAFDYSDCLYRIEKLKKEARNASDSAESASGKDAVEEIKSALSDVESALNKAKRACEVGYSYGSSCETIRNLSRYSMKEAETLCRGYKSPEMLKQCLSCAGIYN